MNLTPEQLSEVRALIAEWRAIGDKCQQIAERHKQKGERLQFHEQSAFAYGRRSCAQQLENLVGGVAEAASAG